MEVPKDLSLTFDPFLLKRFPLFASFEHREIVVLSTAFVRSEVPVDTVLTQQGAKSTHLFAILSGTVDALVTFPGASKQECVATLSEGSIVGEFSLAEIGACTATTRASAEVSMLKGELRLLLMIFERDPEMGRKVYKALSKHLIGRISEMNRNLFYML